jgi:hypothetical protein
VDRKLLSIYLNDHLVASTAGVELARRCAGSNRGTELGEFLEQLTTELEADRAALREVMEELDVGVDRLKQAAGWSGEKAGRLKLNGRWFSYSPLSRVSELEGLALILRMSWAVWRALESVLGTEPELGDEDFAARAAHAEALGERVEGHRIGAVRAALEPPL